MTNILFASVSEHSTKQERLTALESLLRSFDFFPAIVEGDKTAIKTHFGEEKNTTHIAPNLLAVAVQKVRQTGGVPFVTETATLYKGARSDAIAHLGLAQAHGFTYDALGCPIILADGLRGDSEMEVKIADGELFASVNIARDIVASDALVVLSHATGHIVTGAGACIKNLGMGCASRKGKRAQHCSMKPQIIGQQCVSCGTCIRWCPENAIAETNDGVIVIDSDRCIGCGECLAVCRSDAVSIDWGTDSAIVQKRMAEYALGAILGKREKCIYINALIDMTTECDCMGKRQHPVIGDIGFLLSTDPVAIDQATFDLTAQKSGKSLAEISFPHLDASIQLSHGEKIGLGKCAYTLTTV